MVGSTDLGEEGRLPAADDHGVGLEDPKDLVLLLLVLVEQAHDLLPLCRSLPRSGIKCKIMILCKQDNHKCK